MQKKILFAFLTVLIAVGLSAVFVEIGDPTSTTYTNYVPLYGFYDYSWSQTVYLQTEIGAAIDINQIAYNVENTPSNYPTNGQLVYMKHTTDATITSADYPDPANTGWTLVYSGDCVWNGSGWHDIALDTAFNYNGTDNLLICWENYDGTYASSYPRFIRTTGTDRACYEYADGSFPTTAGSIVDYHPNTRLHYTVAGAPGVPSNPSPANGAVDVAVTGTVLTWDFGADTATYDLYFDTVNPPVAQVVADGVAGASGSYDPGVLNGATTYFWQVVAKNASRLETSGPVWEFTTEITPVTAYPYLATFDDGAIPVGWVQDQTDDDDWDVDANGTGSSGTGPDADHTTGSGYYIYTEASGGSTGDIFNIETIPFDITALANPKLNFWYSMYGSDMGTLNVDVWNGSVWTNEWTLSGDQGPGWNEVYVDLAAYNARSIIKIRFQGVRGGGFASDMAVDDVLVADIAGGPPGMVSNPFPADAATGIATAGVTLTWDFGADTETYDLFFDTVYPPVAQVVADAAAGATGSYDTGALDGLTGYFWQVVAKNSSRLVTSGPVWSFATSVAAGQVLIGTGTDTDESLPMEPYYSYSLTQSIYLQSDINTADQQIESIKYHYNGNSAWTEDVVVYMGHTSQTSLTDWLPLSNFVEVYNGLITVPAADGWVTLTLDNPFYYNNTDNLVVMFDANTPGWHDSSDEFYCTQDVRADVSIYDYDDNNNADPAAPPAGTLSTYYPNTVLQFGAVGAPAGNDIYVSEVSDNLVGQPETTGYVELFNNKFYSLDLGGCTLVQGDENAGVFIPTPGPVQYTIPAGTIIGPKGYLTIGNGADAATFDAAWGTSGIDYLPGDVALNITNNWAYQINNTAVRAELDHSPDVPNGDQVVQMDNGVWTPGTPDEGTPGDASPGQTLPVELSSFTALVTTSETVMLEWVTQSETGTLGYHVLRGDSDELQFAGYMTAELIAATNTSEEMTYQFEDIEVWENNTYWYWLETIDADGSSERFGPISCLVLPQGEEVPDFFTTTSMNQNCPNPFNPDTKIIYSLRGTDGVPVNAEMAIYNMRGQLVKTLFSGSAMPGVDLSVTWHGKDDAGNSVGSGVYFYKLTSPGFSQIRKMMLLK
ncbi:MAG: T9SS type A sorting domain-containing protein [Candidatus Cloacimonetes bacterium]|nr:T9SS type A sorting domain-containing protein [Candidatus Cloacimonadota bacterium]